MDFGDAGVVGAGVVGTGGPVPGFNWSPKGMSGEVVGAAGVGVGAVGEEFGDGAG
jgi:hypothetical protein